MPESKPAKPTLKSLSSRIDALEAEVSQLRTQLSQKMNGSRKLDASEECMNVGSCMDRSMQWAKKHPAQLATIMLLLLSLIVIIE